jgi:hypothetical protein
VPGVRQNNDGLRLPFGHRLHIKRVLLLDQMAGLPKELHDFRMFEEVPTMVGDDGEDVGCSGYFGTVLMPVAGRLIRTVSSDRWCRGLTFGSWVF